MILSDGFNGKEATVAHSLLRTENSYSVAMDIDCTWSPNSFVPGTSKHRSHKLSKACNIVQVCPVIVTISALTDLSGFTNNNQAAL